MNGSARHLAAARAVEVRGVEVRGVEGDWDTFFADRVRPVLHVGVPALIVFAVLLVLARVLTNILVTKNAPGTRTRTRRSRAFMYGAYWLGVLALGWSAVEAAVVYPMARSSPPPPPWTSAAAVAATGVLLALIPVLYLAVGRPWGSRTDGSGSERAAALLALPPVAAGLVLVIGLTTTLRGFGWLTGHLAPPALAVLLAVVGIVVVGRTRGLGIGLLIQGHDRTGSDDAGLGASVRARLYALGSHGPAGIQITQQTDVSSLPSEALSLIPEGTLAKVVALLASLFTPATPWRVDVTEQADDSVVVSIMRNGRVAEATVIRPSTLGLPGRRTAADAQDADWTMELRTAAAAFVLLMVARRHKHLLAGLSGATEWRSVALQVVATDTASRLEVPTARGLLTQAVAADGGNHAAEVALLNISYRAGATRWETRRYADDLAELCDKLRDGDEGLDPLRCRLWFNLLVAELNYATFLPRPNEAEGPVDDAALRAAAGAEPALRAAVKQAGNLYRFWCDGQEGERHRREYPELWHDMGGAIAGVSAAIVVEWKRRGYPDPPERERLTRTVGRLSLVGHYESACVLIGQAVLDARSGDRDQAAACEQALDALESAFAMPSLRISARTDPWFSPLRDLDEFRRLFGGTAAVPGSATRFTHLVGDPVPPTFLALAPLAGHRAGLEAAGIHSPTQLLRARVPTLVADTGVTTSVVLRWLELARLHRALSELPPVTSVPGIPGTDADATAMLFLLLERDLDSVDEVRAAVAGPGLRAELLEAARGWAVVAPGSRDLRVWYDRLGTRRPLPTNGRVPPPRRAAPARG